VLSHLLPDVPTPGILQQLLTQEHQQHHHHQQQQQQQQEQQQPSVHLWFSSSSSRSSLHYDPYSNLLCVVTGSKTLRLYSPDAVLGLYPKPLGSEADNHSSVDFEAPDLQAHPLYRCVEPGGGGGASGFTWFGGGGAGKLIRLIW